MNTDRPSNHTNFKNASLLIVEDQADQWLIIEAALQQTLPEVPPTRASGPEEALAYLNNCVREGRSLPRLILMDLYMPDRQDGWALLREIKDESSPYSQVPVIVLSSSQHTEDITESYHYGSTSYVVKPVDFNDWLSYFQLLRAYWWETVTLPKDRYFL